jgi:hypothetical protein
VTATTTEESTVCRDKVRAAVAAELRRDPLADPRRLAVSAWNTVTEADPAFAQTFVFECVLSEVRKAIGGMDVHTADAPVVRSTTLTPLKRAVPKARPSWRDMLADDKPRLRANMLAMTREEVVSEIDRLKDEGLGSLKLAAAYQEIAGALKPGETIGQRWDEATLAHLLGDVDGRAAWVRVAAETGGERPMLGEGQ